MGTQFCPELSRWPVLEGEQKVRAGLGEPQVLAECNFFFFFLIKGLSFLVVG